MHLIQAIGFFILPNTLIFGGYALVELKFQIQDLRERREN